MRLSILALLSFTYLLGLPNLDGQTLLLTEDFEDDGNGTDYRANEFSASNDVFARSDNSNNGPNGNTQAAYTGYLGNDWWCGEDIDDSDNPLGSGADGYIMLKTLDISSYQSGMIEVKIYLAANSQSLHRYETDDYILMKYAYDTDIATGANSTGGIPTQANLTTGTYTTFGAFYGTGTGLTITSSALIEDSDLDGNADTSPRGDSLGNAFTEWTYQFNVGATDSKVSIMVQAATSAGSEEIGIDHIRVYGITGSTPVSTSITAQTNNICNGDALGSLTVTASDGTTPYTYNWSNTATTATISTLGAGTYTVTVTDAGGTTATSSATITEPTALNTAISSQTNVACFGESTGSLTASVTGGTSPYTYNWNSGETSATITGKAAGTYTVSVLDNNGCGEGPPP